MRCTNLDAISPIDGRYLNQLTELQPIFSEFSLMKFRVAIEIAWLKVLSATPMIKEIKPLSQNAINFLNQLIEKFDTQNFEQIKKFEAETNHDLKAVEYFLKEKFTQHPELKRYCEFIHFGCTSEDINNLAYGLMLKTFREQVLLPTIVSIITKLKKLAKKYAALPMLARTHGQPATPTTVGKELANFTFRLNRQFLQLKNAPILGKFNGAVGNFNAHTVAYPKVNWLQLSKKIVASLKLEWNPYTTQIEPHDSFAEFCNTMARLNTILLDLEHDFWHYISIGYFKQKPKAGEIGSSTMPHKVNPIDFENAEGNLGIANALLNHFAAKLPISRLQRDLSDSTVMRNLGVAFAHSILAYRSTLKGLAKVEIDRKKLADDLNQHWEILGEAIQTVMRRYGLAAPYEQLKQLTRSQNVDQKTLADFIQQLNLPTEVKQQLLLLTPENYLGQAIKLAKEI